MKKYDVRVIFRYLISQIEPHYINGDANKMEFNFNKTLLYSGCSKLIQNSPLSYAGHVGPYFIFKKSIKNNHIVRCEKFIGRIK